MAATGTLLTSDLIRQGGSQGQYKLSSKDRDMIKKVQGSLKDFGMASQWADVDIIRVAREIGANATIAEVIDAITSPMGSGAPGQWTSVGGQKKSGRATESNQSRSTRPNQNRNGPRRDKNDAKGDNTQTQNKQESSNQEGTNANDQEQRPRGRREENRRSTGQESGTDRRGPQQNGRGERRGEKKTEPATEKAAPAPAVPVNTWASIVRGKTAEEPATVVVSGKDQKPQGKTTSNKRDSVAHTANDAESETPSTNTSTATNNAAAAANEPTTPTAEPAAAVAAPQIESPTETPHIIHEPAKPEASAASANGQATEKKEESSNNGRNSGRGRGRAPRREKDSASSPNATDASSTNTQATTTSTIERNEVTPVAAEAAPVAPAEKVIMPASFTTSSAPATRRGFASSHVKVAPPASNPTTTTSSTATAPTTSSSPTPAAAPEPVIAAAPVPVASPTTNASTTTTAPTTAPNSGNSAAAAVNTTVPPAITSSMPHMGTHNQMHPGYPGMGFPPQFYPNADGTPTYWPPEMFTHLQHMMYPPYPMPPMPNRGHDGKSTASNTSSTGATNPNLNTQPPMGPMFSPFMPPMNMYGYGYPGAALQTQPPATASTGSHNFGMPAQRQTYGAPRPTPTYEQEEFGYGAPRYEQYGSGAYHPQQHHASHHGQDQKSMSHDSNKMGHYDDHHHQYSSFGGASFHQ